MGRDSGWDMSADGKLHPEVERAHGTLNFGPQNLPPPRDDRPATPLDAIPGSGLGARIGRRGDVYEARSPRLAGRLALKIYRRATGVDLAVVDAFSREAARASALRHPHIAQVIESGALRDGTPFATMEYLGGHNLEELLAGRGAFLATELLPVVRGTASALSAAHAAGIAHGELRPDNIFIADVAGYEHGFAKLLDFGAWHLTAAQIAAGRDPSEREMRYLAPERLSRPRADASARADQFALAAIAYRMLIGSDPSSASHARGAGADSGWPRTGAASPTSPLARRAPAVEAVISKALSRQAENRFESVALFMRAFEEALAGAALISTPAPLRSAPPPNRGEHGSGADERGRAAQPQHPASDRLTLTQQFFDEGERQEAANYKNTRLDSGSFSQPNLDFESFDRVPRRRKPLVLAVVVTIAGAGALAWVAGLRPPVAWQRSAPWQTLHLPDPRPPVASEPTTASREPERVAAPLAAPAAAPSPAPAAQAAPTVTIPVPAGTPAVTAAADQPAAAPTPAAPIPPSPPQVAISPPELPSARPGNGVTETSRPPTVVPLPHPVVEAARAAAMPPHLQRSRKASQGSGVATRTPALRGYIWSPEQQAMVPAGPAARPSGQSEPWPPASESSPPPPARPPHPPTDPSLNPPPFNP